MLLTFVCHHRFGIIMQNAIQWWRRFMSSLSLPSFGYPFYGEYCENGKFEFKLQTDVALRLPERQRIFAYSISCCVSVYFAFIFISSMMVHPPVSFIFFLFFFYLQFSLWNEQKPGITCEYRKMIKCYFFYSTERITNVSDDAPHRSSFMHFVWMYITCVSVFVRIQRIDLQRKMTMCIYVL